MTHFPTRYYFVCVSIVIFLHLSFSFWKGDYHTPPSISYLAGKWPLNTKGRDQEPVPGSPASIPHSYAHSHAKANATFVILVRNSELKEIVESLKQIEDRFNRQYHYPYVFLNEEPFSEEFKRWTGEIISSPAYYGLIPREHWYQPDTIDEARAARMRHALQADDVIYGDSVPYRNMCRFNSGFFYKHPLMQQFRYYWRVEPGVKFFCDVTYDPFVFMEQNNKTYGFTISMYEYERTIPSLWTVTKEFIRRHPEHLAPDNAMRFLSDDGGNTYNLCHFWSNFEIGDMNLWRSKAYTDYFDFLDANGGFYYERWGDAPVHSIGAALFSSKDQIHFFKDIGYRHEPFQNCPQGNDHRKGKCWCEEKDSFTYEGYSCTSRWDRLYV
ncbi:glycosyltransferase family 15 protein [Serendipita vermifera MAFF 305830]|uniref:Glycosyltransferase family 15 protein n=1 Tax=Serendipita vermifera MAFF 305830 TaxID=933852 RepID=A0A0C2WUA5_SERVB|nr:glycosyltransferase family 15 protein [Serendipita vermifera MAFF 305830]